MKTPSCITSHTFLIIPKYRITSTTLFYISLDKKAETHRTGADSRRQPDPSGSTRHVRSHHHRKNEFHDNTKQQLDKNLIPHLIIPHIDHTLKPTFFAEQQLQTENRLHPAVHRSTALCGMLSDSSLTAAPPETTYETQRPCIITKLQRGKITFIHNLREIEKR